MARIALTDNFWIFQETKSNNSWFETKNITIIDSNSLRPGRLFCESGSHASCASLRSHASLASPLQITPFSLVSNLFYFDSRVSEVRIGHVANSLLGIYLTLNEDHAPAKHDSFCFSSSHRYFFTLNPKRYLHSWEYWLTALNTLRETKI